MALKGQKHLNSFANDEHDMVEYRKRVATYVDGNAVSYEDPDFTEASNNTILDVFADLGRIGHKGYFINDGPGAIRVEISSDGTTYGGLQTLYGGDTFILDDLTIKRMRLSYVDPTEYRAVIA